MSIVLIIILVLSGIIVGFINTLSAGGTTISIALYLAMGISPVETNAINRVGVLIQNGFASAMFYKKKVLNYKEVLLWALPVFMGTFLGAMFAVHINAKVFNICFAVVMFVMILFLIFDTKKKNHNPNPFTLRRYFISMPLFLAAGFYGGFVQAGTGFLLIALLGSVAGYDLVATTAAKNLIMFLYTIVAMIVFLLRAEVTTVYWFYALIHSIGCVIGSFIAAKYAIKKGNRFVKIVIICVLILVAMNLLGIIDMNTIFKNILEL